MDLLQGASVNPPARQQPSDRHKTIKDCTVAAWKIKGIFRVSWLAQVAKVNHRGTL
jgi:hypothetical protein